MDKQPQQSKQQQQQHNQQDEQLLLALKISQQHYQKHQQQLRSQQQPINHTPDNIHQNFQSQTYFNNAYVSNQKFEGNQQFKDCQQQTNENYPNNQYSSHKQRHGRGWGPREFKEGNQQNGGKEGEHYGWGPQQGWGQHHPWNKHHGWGRHHGWNKGEHHPGWGMGHPQWGMNQQQQFSHCHPFWQMMANQHQSSQGFPHWGNFWGSNNWERPQNQTHNENDSREHSQNQWRQHCQFRGRGGRGRGGRGWRGRWNDCQRDEVQKQSKKQRMDSSTSSNSSSSSSKQKKKLRKQMQKEDKKKKKFMQKQHVKNDFQDLSNKFEKMSFSCKQEKLKYEHIFDSLKYFFEKYKYSEKTEQKIIKYLYGNKLSDEKLGELVSILHQLEQCNENYFHYLGFLSIIKQTFKRRFEFDDIKQKLDKKIAIRDKKQVNDSKFKVKFPKPVCINFLQIEQLLDLNLNKTLFLIDGNNIMPKQKIFRAYFQSEKQKLKAQGQIRLAWLFSLTLNFQLFFDNKYEDQLYSKIKNKIIVSSQQKEDVDNSSVFYADKQINDQNTADMKILERLTQITKDEKYKNHTIILVSADKQLAQLCAQIQPNIQQTSGFYIFNFCKKVIRRKFYNQTGMKGIIKLIFTF